MPSLSEAQPDTQLSEAPGAGAQKAPDCSLTSLSESILLHIGGPVNCAGTFLSCVFNMSS